MNLSFRKKKVKIIHKANVVQYNSWRDNSKMISGQTENLALILVLFSIILILPTLTCIVHFATTKKMMKGDAYAVWGIFSAIVSCVIVLLLILVSFVDPRFHLEFSYGFGMTIFYGFCAILLLIFGFGFTISSFRNDTSRMSYVSLALNLSFVILYLILGSYFWSLV